MKSFLMNKKLSFYYRLKEKVENRVAFRFACNIKKVITLFGRED
jgi:hypothetical protein